MNALVANYLTKRAIEKRKKQMIRDFYKNFIKKAIKEGLFEIIIFLKNKYKDYSFLIDEFEKNGFKIKIEKSDLISDMVTINWEN